MNAHSKALSAPVDVAVVGAGPVGASLALLTAAVGSRVVLFEAAPGPPGAGDPRALAVSRGSMLVLQRIGVWSRLTRSAPIRAVHVSQKGAFGRTLLTAEAAGVPELGSVVDYRELARALHEALAERGLDVRYGARVVDAVVSDVAVRVLYEQAGERRELDARLIVHADGARGADAAPAEERDYGQWAVVAQVEAERGPCGIAYERFTPEGPVALLPSWQGYALVWTAAPAHADALIRCPEAEFLAELHAHFGDRVGRFVAAGSRAGFPLSLRRVKTPVAARSVWIGNAAHTLHPVAGQGFNLGLRDAFELAQQTRPGGAADLGGAAQLARFERGRRLDVDGVVFFTDSLVRVFGSALPGIAAARGLGLAMLDLLPPAKGFFARRMMFGPRG